MSSNPSGPQRKRSVWSYIIPVVLVIGILALILYFVLAPGRGMPTIGFTDADIREVQTTDESGQPQIEYEGDLADILQDDYVYRVDSDGDGVNDKNYQTSLYSVSIQKSAYSDNLYYVSGAFYVLDPSDSSRALAQYGFQATLAPQTFDYVIGLINSHPELYGGQEGTVLYSGVTIESTNDVWSWLWPVIYIVIMLLLGWLIVRMMTRSVNSAGGQMMSFNKSPAKRATQSKVRFSDVAGCDEVKDELREVVEYFHSNEKYKKMGAVLPKGILLVGPPGTGKTLLAKAVAGEASVPFFSISGSDFVEMYVGVGAGRVRDLFNTAKKNAPCLIFIDEIDAVGRQRGAGLGGGNDEREQTLNQLLVEMDGFAENSGVIVMAATNREDVLDPALLRPGRFDRTITVDYPDKAGREAILKVHSRTKPLASDVDFSSVAARTVGFSGADLANVMNEAAIMAVRNNRDAITMMDIDEAIDRRIAGPAKKTHMDDDDKRQVAYHEAGHAIVGLTLPAADKVQSVTIIPRGRTGGHTLMAPEKDRFLYTKQMILARIAGYMGGRASEEIFFGDVSTGASDDFEKATQLARSMVTEYGMSSLGPVQYENPNQNVFLGRDYNTNKNFSDQVAYEIDQAEKQILEECYKKAHDIIEQRKDDVTLIAQALIDKETITASEISYLLEHRCLPTYEEHKKAEPAGEDVFASYKPKNPNNITLIPEYLNFYKDVDDIISHGFTKMVICAYSPTSGPLDPIAFKAHVQATFPDGQVGVIFIEKADLKDISASTQVIAQHLEKYSGLQVLYVTTDEASIANLKNLVSGIDE